MSIAKISRFMELKIPSVVKKKKKKHFQKIDNRENVSRKHVESRFSFLTASIMRLIMEFRVKS